MYEPIFRLFLQNVNKKVNPLCSGLRQNKNLDDGCCQRPCADGNVFVIELRDDVLAHGESSAPVAVILRDNLLITPDTRVYTTWLLFRSVPAGELSSLPAQGSTDENGHIHFVDRWNQWSSVPEALCVTSKAFLYVQWPKGTWNWTISCRKKTSWLNGILWSAEKGTKNIHGATPSSS